MLANEVKPFGVKLTSDSETVIDGRSAWKKKRKCIHDGTNKKWGKKGLKEMRT